MWMELTESFTSSCIFYDPATPEEIAEAEATLGIPLPKSLKDFLLETNGLDLRPSFVDWDDDDSVLGFISPLDELVETNLELHSTDEDTALETLLFFASGANGDYYAFPQTEGKVTDAPVIRVSHENFSERDEILVDSFQAFLRLYLEAMSEEEHRVTDAE